MLAATAVTAILPSTERSMLPIKMMKVIPMVKTTGIAALFRRREKFPRLRKFGLTIVIITQRMNRTTTGAHVLQRSIRLTDFATLCVIASPLSRQKNSRTRSIRP